MNFEIIDNVFQVAVFFAAALGDMVYWFYKRDRLYIILALVHRGKKSLRKILEQGGFSYADE